MMQERLMAGIEKGATFSEDRVYRYVLWRIWDAEGPMAMFTGLNASTADETVDDPTIRRDMTFAKDWGYGGLYKTNIFGFRATDPRRLAQVDDPIGPGNDTAIAKYAGESDIIIACWGIHGVLLERGHDVREHLIYQGHGHKLHHLGLTQHGMPKHPLYLRRDTQPQLWGP